MTCWEVLAGDHGSDGEGWGRRGRPRPRLGRPHGVLALPGPPGDNLGLPLCGMRAPEGRRGLTRWGFLRSCRRVLEV